MPARGLPDGPAPRLSLIGAHLAVLTRPMRRGFVIVLLAASGGATWTFWMNRDATGPGPASAVSSPADVRQAQLLDLNLGRPSDVDLMERYQELNREYFSGALPVMTIRWESRLAEVGTLATPKFTLEGMFGHTRNQQAILLNPSLKSDGRARDRALCHEMVHAHLFALGNRSTAHDDAFKAELGRLASAGAFEGVAASDEEKASLRVWLDEESSRLDAEQAAIDGLRTDLSRAGGADAGQAAALTDRIARDRDDVAHLNSEIARYNLMMSYPDGYDEPAVPGR